MFPILYYIPSVRSSFVSPILPRNCLNSRAEAVSPPFSRQKKRVPPPSSFHLVLHPKWEEEEDSFGVMDPHGKGSHSLPLSASDEKKKQEKSGPMTRSARNSWRKCAIFPNGIDSFYFKKFVYSAVSLNGIGPASSIKKGSGGQGRKEWRSGSLAIQTTRFGVVGK